MNVQALDPSSQEGPARPGLASFPSPSEPQPSFAKSSRFALKCLLKGSAPIACFPIAITSHCILVEEASLKRLQFADGTLNCIQQASLYDVGLCAVQLRNRHDCIAVLCETSRILFFTAQLELSKHCIRLPDESPFSRPSRLMTANKDGSLIAIASFESSLWIVSSDKPDSCIPQHILLPSMPMALEFVDSARLAVFLSSEIGSDRICFVEIGAPQPVVLSQFSAAWSGEIIHCALVPSIPHLVISFDECNVSLLDLNQRKLVFSVEIPVWQPKNFGHRPVQGSAPLPSAIHLSPDGRILMSLESGDLFHVAVREVGVLELFHLGVTNPARVLVAFSPLDSRDCASSASTIVALYGDYCDGCLLTVNEWFPPVGSETTSITILDTLSCLSPILDADVLTSEDEVVVGCHSGKHGRLSILQRGIPFKSISSVSRGMSGLRRILSIDFGRTFNLLLFCFVSNSRLLDLRECDGKFVLHDVTDDWDICHDSTTIAASQMYHQHMLCQIHEYGIRNVRCPQPGGTTCILSEERSDSPILAASVLESGYVLTGTENYCDFYYIDQADFSIIPFIKIKHPFSDITALKLCSETIDSRCFIWSLFCYSNGVVQIGIPDLDLCDFRVVATLTAPSDDLGCIRAIECVELLRSRSNDTMHLFLSRRDGKIDRFFLPVSHFYSKLQAKESICFSTPQTIDLGLSPVTMSIAVDHTGATLLLAICQKPFLIRLRGEAVEIQQCCDWSRLLPSKITASAPDHSPFLISSGLGSGIFAVIFDDQMFIVEMKRVLDKSSVMHKSVIPKYIYRDDALHLTPRRLVYDPSSNIIVCACTDSIEGTPRSKLFLFSNLNGSFSSFGSLQSKESVQSLYIWNTSNFGKVLCVGTSISTSMTALCSNRGRLLCYLFSENAASKLTGSRICKSHPSSPISLMCEAIGEAVLSIAAMNQNRLCIASTDSVQVFKVSCEDIVSLFKIEIYDWVVHISCRALSEKTGVILVCGSRGGLKFLQYQGTDGPITVISANGVLHPATRCSMLADGNGFVADKMGSIAVISPQNKTTFCQAFLYLGETVSKITTKDQTRLQIFTLSGSIYEVQPLGNDFLESDGKVLEDLQACIMRHFNIPAKYRSGSLPLKAFLDIDLLRKWFDIPLQRQRYLLESVSTEYSVQTVLSLLDRLSR